MALSFLDWVLYESPRISHAENSEEKKILLNSHLMVQMYIDKEKLDC